MDGVAEGVVIMSSAMAVYERWEDIPGYGGLYRVSDAGQVLSLARNGTGGGVLKFDINNAGYYQVRLYKGNKSRVFRVHRLVLAAFSSPSELQVNHKNGVKTDNRLENLEYVTASQNARHARKLLGQWSLTGERHPNAKLTDGDVKAIKSASGRLSQRELARMFGISEAQVSRIVNKKRRNHD